MFDEVEIDGKIFKMFFDKGNFKLHIENNYRRDVEDYFSDKNIVKISNYILFIDTKGRYNSSSIEYNVESYVRCDMKEFKPKDFKFVIFKSNKIAQLLYSAKKQEKYKCSIKTNKTDFDVFFICSNKLNISKYYEVTNESCVQLKINKCDDWVEFFKIIKSILNSLTVISIDKGIDDCDIYLFKKKSKYDTGEIKFSKHNYPDDSINYLGNIHKVQDVMQNIIETIYDTPNISLNFIPSYARKYNYLDFFNIYSSFEYEYKFINKEEMYDAEMKNELNKSTQMKLDILNELKASNINLTEHFKRYINNYNPVEGHRQKLENAFIFCNGFMNNRLSYIGINEKKEEFIKYIYNTRIKVVHDPSENIAITNMWYKDIFNEIIYSLFLKRCNIDNSRINSICDNILIPVV